MKNLIFLIILIGCGMRTLGQSSTPDTALQSLIKIDLGFQGVGLSYEPRISNKITVDFAAGMGGGYRVTEDNTDYEWSFLKPAYYFMITPRFYYNRAKRISKGKSILNNAGNYWGARVRYTTGNNSISLNNRVRPALLFNIHWGIQRPLGQRWLLNAHAGLGHAIDLNSGFANIIYPAVDVKFAYILGKAKH